MTGQGPDWQPLHFTRPGPRAQPRPLPSTSAVAERVRQAAIDVGSTTCKFVLRDADDRLIAQGYERHHTRQAALVLRILEDLEASHDLAPGRDQLLLTGSGAGTLAPLLGARLVQEVVAVAAAVDRLHPAARFVSEIGGEDMKTIFFGDRRRTSARQVFMQSACSGGTGTFIEKTARKLGLDAAMLGTMPYLGRSLHSISSKCGIFAEADANAMTKAGIPTEDIIASLFEAVVLQNLAVLTRGNTPLPQVVLLGGPNVFYAGLKDAWRVHLERLWQDRDFEADGIDVPVEDALIVPDNATLYAALGCLEIGRAEGAGQSLYRGQSELRRWLATARQEEKQKEGLTGFSQTPAQIAELKERYRGARPSRAAGAGAAAGAIAIGCDFGSTTAKAVALSAQGEVCAAWYAPSVGNPIEDARALFAQIEREVPEAAIGSLGVTGYGKDLLSTIVGADVALVETVAHATAGLHFFPAADCICDVGGIDTKILLLRNGTIADFRLNSQCSSGNGAFLQGIADRFSIELGAVAERALGTTVMPRLAMGCGVFLQSDIVNQQRKGWEADEILAGLCATLPLNVWVYAAGLHNLREVGRRFILQGGTHRNIAVVKAQTDYIRSQVPDAEVVLHPYPGEAGAIGAALAAAARADGPSRFRGFAALKRLTYRTTTRAETTCQWCPTRCRRTFIDFPLEGAAGRPWSRVPLAPGEARLIVNNSCAKGLVEDKAELKVVRAKIDQIKSGFPNLADRVRTRGFRVSPPG